MLLQHENPNTLLEVLVSDNGFMKNCRLQGFLVTLRCIFQNLFRAAILGPGTTAIS